MMYRLQKRANGYYYARCQKKSLNKRISLETTNKKVAEQRIAELNEAAFRESLGISRRERIVSPPLRDILEPFLKHKKARRRPAGYTPLEYTVKKHFLVFRDLPLDQITRSVIKQWQDNLVGDGLSNATVNRASSILRQLFVFAEDLGLIQPHSAPLIGHLKETPPPIQVFTDEEVRAILSCAPGIGRDVAVFAHLGILAGLRRMEILSLRAQDVDRQHRQLVICRHLDDGFMPKSRQERRVPIHADLWPWLDLQDGHYFPPSRNEELHRREYRKPFAALMRVSGIQWVATPHTMRHTAGTRWARGGATALQIQQLMGHSDAKTSERYIHLAGSPELRERVQAVPLVLS